MSVSDKFQTFNRNIRISSSDAEKISYRYKRITKQLNKDFRSYESDSDYSLYIGSYGRDTDIHVSDIDMLIQLPVAKYSQYNNYIGNGQSALLQEVKRSIENTYSVTRIGADGQVIVVPFDDNIKFEVLPTFINDDNSYTYPDSNGGGSWKVTNPRAEIEAIRKANNDWNHNLKNLCRMARAWKEKWDVPIGGLLIDTLAYNFLKQSRYTTTGYVYYDWMVRDFFAYLKDQNENQNYWYAPGSGQSVRRKGNFEYKALRCYNISLEAIDYEEKNMPYSANGKWKEIFGSKFTG